MDETPSLLAFLRGHLSCAVKGRREIFFDRDPQLPQRTSAAAGRQATNGEPRRASACK